MSCSKWAYTPGVCDGGGCPGDCDLCDKPKNMEDEDDTTDYIKREDAQKITAEWLSGYITDDERNVIEHIDVDLGELPPADVVEVVRCKDCKWYHGIGCAIKIVDESDEPTDNDYCSYGERA